MNPLDQKSETCTSQCECATSVDTSSLTEDMNQSSVKSNAKSNDKEPSTEVVMAKSKGPWTDKEHSAFLEGLEKYGIDWKQIATLVKSRNAEEVQRHFYSYQQEEPFLSTLIRMLDDKSLDNIIAWNPGGRAFCIYNEKKCVSIALLLYYRSLFFQGIEHFERELHMYGFCKDMNDSSVWFHPQFCRDSSLAARNLEKKPNHNLISGSSRNAKRSRGQTRDCTSTTSKKRKARESIEQKSDELSIVIPEKDTALDGEAQNMIDSTNSLKPFHQTNTDFERNNEATCDDLVQESNELRDESKLLLPYSDKLNKGKWTDKEHRLFVEGLELYGIEDLKKIASHIKTRTNYQVRYYADEYFSKTKNTKTGRWADEEQRLFIEGLELYGEGEWKKIASHVRTRTWPQVKNHFTRTGKSTDGTRSLSSEDMTSYDSLQDVKGITEKEEDDTNDKNTQVISENSNQRKGKALTTSESRIALKDNIETNTGKWSVGEHCLFLEGLEQHGRSWQDVASHVKTRTALQVNNHGRDHLKKIDCYWTTKEHLRFLEGLKRFGRGRWVEIATHVETKNNKQVAFHAKEYFKEERKMIGKSQKMDNNVDDSVGIMKTNDRDWYWSAEEHNRFLEGLEQHGRSWKNVASHVKTRTYVQVNGYGYRYLNKIDCYWTNNEHLLFLEGLDQHGRGHWADIATHVGTKNNDQVAYHAKEYFKEEEINGKSQKTKNGSDEHSPVARMLVNKPNHYLINVSSTNVKRNIDQAGDSTSTSSKKRITRVSIKQKNDEQRIVTPEKNTGLEGDMHRMIDSTNSLKSIYQKANDLQNGNEATGNNLEPESNEDIQGIAEKEEVINDKKHSAPDDIDDTSCPICLEKLNDPHIVPECCHRFCKGCIEEALEHRRECPICRGRVTSRRALRRDEVFGKLMQLLEVERAKLNANSALTLTITNAGQLSDNTVAIDFHPSKTGEKNERIDVANSIQEVCMKKIEENQIRVEEKQNAQNKNVEMKSQDKAIKIQLQHDGRASDHLETQLEEKNTKIHTLENSVRSLSASVNDLKTQLRDKKDRIQFLESRKKADKVKLQDDMKRNDSFLRTQLEEKNTKIKALEKLIRTLSDQTKIQQMAAAVNDLQSQSQHKDDRIQFLESRHKADEEKLQQHCKKSEEKNLEIKTLKKQIRTLSEHTLLQKNERLVTKLQQQNDIIKNLKSRQKDDEKHYQNMAALATEDLQTQLKEKKLIIKTLEKKIESNDVKLKKQLQEKNDRIIRIQFLQLKQKADEEKLQNMAKQALVSKDLENQLKEKNARIQTLEKMVRTLSHDDKLQKIAAKFQEKNDRIKDLEEKLQQITKKLDDSETKLQPINDRIQQTKKN